MTIEKTKRNRNETTPRVFPSPSFAADPKGYVGQHLMTSAGFKYTGHAFMHETQTFSQSARPKP